MVHVTQMIWHVAGMWLICRQHSDHSYFIFQSKFSKIRKYICQSSCGSIKNIARILLNECERNESWRRIHVVCKILSKNWWVHSSKYQCIITSKDKKDYTQKEIYTEYDLDMTQYGITENL